MVHLGFPQDAKEVTVMSIAGGRRGRDGRIGV